MRVDPDEGMATDEALRSLPRELMIVAFCDEPHQAASMMVARRARELGRGDASVLDGGLSAWRDAGLPTIPVPPGGRQPLFPEMAPPGVPSTIPPGTEELPPPAPVERGAKFGPPVKQ